MAMPESGIPFIFMNHASSEGDVRVMVHEGGHAVHSFLDYKVKFAQMRQTPSEVAEIADRIVSSKKSQLRQGKSSVPLHIN